MRVLVACEESQRVCQAFRDKGHEAYSCDILPTSGDHPEWHYQIPVERLIVDPKSTPTIIQRFDEKGMQGLRRIDINCHWNLLVAFVPCDHLAVSGARWFNEKREDGRQELAIQFFLEVAGCFVDKICIENPVGVMSGDRKYLKKHFPYLYDESKSLPKPQIIQPWQFGHGETKATCLWLKGLPKLIPTNIVEGREQRIFKMAPGPNRARDRSRTYPGIAKAMADQWG